MSGNFTCDSEWELKERFAIGKTDILTLVKYRKRLTVKGSIVFTLLWAQDIRIVVPLHGAFAQLCVCARVYAQASSCSMGYSVTVSVFSLGRVFFLQAAGEALLFNLVKRIILKAKALSTVHLPCGVVHVCA